MVEGKKPKDEKFADLDYLKYLEAKENWTEEEKFIFETLSMQNKRELPDLDYLEYLRTKGRWSRKEKLLWSYLSAIVQLLLRLTGEDPKQEGKPNLMGRYKPYHPPDKGIRKGPPPVIV
jgi:hypothetical protein